METNAFGMAMREFEMMKILMQTRMLIMVPAEYALQVVSVSGMVTDIFGIWTRTLLM